MHQEMGSPSARTPERGVRAAAVPRQKKRGVSGCQRPSGGILVFRMLHILVDATACNPSIQISSDSKLEWKQEQSLNAGVCVTHLLSYDFMSLCTGLRLSYYDKGHVCLCSYTPFWKNRQRSLLDE